jgi:hypothetical protein
MAKDEMTINAENRKTGMQPDEILTAIGRARSAGFTILDKTRVGFAGQIQSMIFRVPSGGEHGQAEEGDPGGAGPRAGR